MVSWSDLEIGWNPVTRHVLFLSLADRDLDLARIEHALVATAELDLQLVFARRKRQPREMDLAGQGKPAAGVGALGENAGDVHRQPEQGRGGVRAAVAAAASAARRGGERVLGRHAG